MFVFREFFIQFSSNSLVIIFVKMRKISKSFVFLKLVDMGRRFNSLTEL